MLVPPCSVHADCAVRSVNVALVQLRTLITGKATMLESRFRLRYNMIVNLLRVEDLSVEDMLKRSFMELRAQRALKDQTHLLSQGEQVGWQRTSINESGKVALTDHPG